MCKVSVNHVFHPMVKLTVLGLTPTGSKFKDIIPVHREDIYRLKFSIGELNFKFLPL